MDKYIHIILRQYPMSDHKLDIYREETRKDPTLQMRIKYATSILPYMHVRDEISVVKGLELKRCTYNSPKLFKKRGPTKNPHWTFRDRKVHRTCKGSHILAQYKQPDQRNDKHMHILHRSTIHHEIPKTPWTKVATDIFDMYNNKVYVVIIDYTTRYFDIHTFDNCESYTLINKIKNTFARLGINTRIVISDMDNQNSNSLLRNGILNILRRV